MLTVKDLREFLVGVPEDYEVDICITDSWGWPDVDAAYINHDEKEFILCEHWMIDANLPEQDIRKQSDER